MMIKGDFLGTMPHFRDIFPKYGDIGSRNIKKILGNLYLRDCLFVLSKLSLERYKQCCLGFGSPNGFEIYKRQCLELMDAETVKAIRDQEVMRNKGEYDVIFPDLSITNLVKLCLKYCDDSNYTKSDEFSAHTLNGIGKCLLIMNSIMVEEQLAKVSIADRVSEELVVNFTKQLIADGECDVLQKMYQNYFLFELLKKYNKDFDLEEIFHNKYGVCVKEYFAFLFLLYSKFAPENNRSQAVQHVKLDQAFEELKPKFKINLLENLIINNIKFKKIDESFFNITDITRRPLIKLSDDAIIPMNYRCLFLGITDSVYFDIGDYIEDEKDKARFSEYYGCAIEDYFKSIISVIDRDAKFIRYGKGNKQANDAIIIQNKSAIFFECKKRPFHTLEFIKSGDKELFFKRINEFYHKPLQQICNRINDFRNEEFVLEGVDRNALIYPVVVCPQAPPIFSGAWDRLNLDQLVLPGLYQFDKNIAKPEFIDLAELECIEEYLRMNPSVTFVDLIKVKREDEYYHNANWKNILYKNDMNLRNRRLAEKYYRETGDFRGLLF